MPWKETQGWAQPLSTPTPPRKPSKSRSLPTLLTNKTHGSPSSKAKQIAFDCAPTSQQLEETAPRGELSREARSTKKGSHRVDLRTQALTISRRYKIDFHEVHFALKALKKVPCARPNGGMEVMHFKRFLQLLFEAKHIPDVVWEGAYTQSRARDGPLDVDKFFLWYRNSMFTSVAFMMADREMRENDDLIASVARRHAISRIEAGRIKQKFDEFDLDGSGEIGFDEFRKMMASLMCMSDLSDVPPDRMNRFWKEIDSDQSGSVDFQEFTDWFLKYFPDGQSGGVVEAFYASYSPDVLRTRALHAEDQVGDTTQDDPHLKLDHLKHLQGSNNFRRSSIGEGEAADSRRKRRLSSVYCKFGEQESGPCDEAPSIINGKRHLN